MDIGDYYNKFTDTMKEWSQPHVEGDKNSTRKLTLEEKAINTGIGIGSVGTVPLSNPKKTAAYTVAGGIFAIGAGATATSVTAAGASSLAAGGAVGTYINKITGMSQTLADLTMGVHDYINGKDKSLKGFEKACTDNYTEYKPTVIEQAKGYNALGQTVIATAGAITSASTYNKLNTASTLPQPATYKNGRLTGKPIPKEVISKNIYWGQNLPKGGNEKIIDLLANNDKLYQKYSKLQNAYTNNPSVSNQVLADHIEHLYQKYIDPSYVTDFQRYKKI